MDIDSQFTDLRLHGMQRSWKALTETRQHLELSLADGLQVLLQAESEDRSNRRFKRLAKNAHFRYQASIEELHMDASNGSRHRRWWRYWIKKTHLQTKL